MSGQTNPLRGSSHNSQSAAARLQHVERILSRRPPGRPGPRQRRDQYGNDDEQEARSRPDQRKLSITCEIVGPWGLAGSAGESPQGIGSGILSGSPDFTADFNAP